MKLDKNTSLILLVVCIAVGIILLIRGKKNKAIKEKEVTDIRARIQQDVGSFGVDVNSTVYGVAPQPGYNGKVYADKIYNAKSIWNDDEDAIYTALSGKTRAQLASISQAFESAYGMTMDDFLMGFLSGTEYQNVVNIIQKAK